MNEILTALESMIRRIVAEEMAKMPAATRNILDGAAVDARIRDWLLDGEHHTVIKDVVKVACLDQGWFDEAIESEAALAVDRKAEDPEREPVDIASVARKLFDDGYFADKLHREVRTAIQNTNFTVRVN